MICSRGAILKQLKTNCMLKFMWRCIFQLMASVMHTIQNEIMETSVCILCKYFYRKWKFCMTMLVAYTRRIKPKHSNVHKASIVLTKLRPCSECGIIWSKEKYFNILDRVIKSHKTQSQNSQLFSMRANKVCWDLRQVALIHTHDAVYFIKSCNRCCWFFFFSSQNFVLYCTVNFFARDQQRFDLNETRII